MGIDQKKEPSANESIIDLDGPVALCGGSLWDIHNDFEQMEALTYAGKSSCELGFEKVSMYFESTNGIRPIFF